MKAKIVAGHRCIFVLSICSKTFYNWFSLRTFDCLLFSAEKKKISICYFITFSQLSVRVRKLILARCYTIHKDTFYDTSRKEIRTRGAKRELSRFATKALHLNPSHFSCYLFFIIYFMLSSNSSDSLSPPYFRRMPFNFHKNKAGDRSALISRNMKKSVSK